MENFDISIRALIRLTGFAKSPSCMFDRILNTPMYTVLLPISGECYTFITFEFIDFYVSSRM